MMRMRYLAQISLSISFLALTLISTSGFAQQTVLSLWPHATPEPAQTTEIEIDVTKPTDAFISGHRTARLTNVTVPTLTVYSPPASVKNTGAAALVFPGGGYVRLAWDGEGVDTCTWLNSAGMTCLLVKYRVPEKGHYPDNFADLEDAQQAMRISRSHAKEWNIDPNRIGVAGFSAGGNLAVLMSTHSDDRNVESTPAATDIDAKIDARPNFAIVVYPAYLVAPSDPNNPNSPVAMPVSLSPVYMPNKLTPPTFLIQAENDKTYGKNAPVYFQALAAAGVPVELHMYATGGHGFGIHPPGMPEEHWTDLADAWLRSIKMIP
jgi:acetyl esterase/lipase